MSHNALLGFVYLFLLCFLNLTGLCIHVGFLVLVLWHFCVYECVCVFIYLFLEIFLWLLFSVFIHSFQDCLFSFYLILLSLLLLLFTLDACLYLNERKKERLSTWVSAEEKSV